VSKAGRGCTRPGLRPPETTEPVRTAVVPGPLAVDGHVLMIPVRVAEMHVWMRVCGIDQLGSMQSALYSVSGW
jgi:hypothetical protein